MSGIPDKSIGAKLLHPRRSLGTRYRVQAERFLDNGGDSDIVWAEQMAAKAVLHDFTDPMNWKVLVRSRISLGDGGGVFSCLKDLFSVLGRDPALTDLLVEVDMIEHGNAILGEALRIDPLDPDQWLEEDKPIDEFLAKVRSLDFTDPRANLLFSRRLERLLSKGMEDEYLVHAPILLSQRPLNHEAWTKLGRIHERRGESDRAWHCYDQAQVAYPPCEEKDRYMERMAGIMDGQTGRAWRRPPVESRSAFLEGLQRYANIDVEDGYQDHEEADGEDVDPITLLVEEGRLNEAFFLARRRAAEGVEGAEELLQEISEMM